MEPILLFILFILFCFILKLNSKINKISKVQENFDLTDVSLKQSIYNLGKIAESINSGGVLTLPNNVIINGELTTKQDAEITGNLNVSSNVKAASYTGPIHWTGRTATKFINDVGKWAASV